MAALEARILHAASSLFFTHGYGATSMAAIARAARVSKVTLYARFPNRAALFRAIVAEQFAKWEPSTPVVDDYVTLEAALRACGDIALRSGLADDRIHIGRLMFAESTRFPELGKVADQRHQRGIQYVAGYIRAFAIRDKIPCRDPEAAADIFVTTLLGWTNHAMIRNRAISSRQRNAWLDRAVRTFVASRATW